MYILSPFFILEFCLRKTLEVWNHRRPWRLGNVHPCTFLILEFCLRKTLEVWNHGHPESDFYNLILIQFIEIFL